MADDYYAKRDAAKQQARTDDAERYGQTTASTPTDSSRYPTQRYSVMGGAVSDNFQTSSALIRDTGGSGPAKGYYIGDTLPDGSNIQDIITSRDGGVAVSVILPDGREAMLGSRQPRPAAAASKVAPDRRAALRQVVSTGAQGARTGSVQNLKGGAAEEGVSDAGSFDDWVDHETGEYTYSPERLAPLDRSFLQQADALKIQPRSRR